MAFTREGVCRPQGTVGFQLARWCNIWVCEVTEQYFPVVIFIVLFKMVLTSFESVDNILKCDHLNESYWVLLSFGAVYYAVQGGSYFWVCE